MTKRHKKPAAKTIRSSSSQSFTSPAHFAIAILAAGKGTRLKSRLPKVLHQIGGKPLLQHVIDAAKKVVAAEDIYAIVGHEADRVKQAVAHNGSGFVDKVPIVVFLMSVVVSLELRRSITSGNMPDRVAPKVSCDPF